MPYYYLDDAGSRQSFNVAYDGVAPRFPQVHQYSNAVIPTGVDAHIDDFPTFVSQDGSEIIAKRCCSNYRW